MSEDKNFLEKLADKGKETIEGLKRQYGIGGGGNPWPQTEFNPLSSESLPPPMQGGPAGGQTLYRNYKTRGWLPPLKIPISSNGDLTLDEDRTVPGGYTYKDWRGHKLTLSEIGVSDTKDKFEKSQVLPKNESGLADNPYSTRDHYLIFGDTSTDYFRHGLHVIDELTPIENPENGQSTLRRDLFKGTPFELNDPVMFGFDLIIDDVSSPLLNGSILDFIRNYQGINEIASKAQVYEDFKQQFSKIFKTKTNTIDISDEFQQLQTTMSKMREGGYPEIEGSSDIFQSGKRAYLNYYLKKVTGLDKLSESNTPSAKKYLAEYNKDVITLNFSEDLTLTMGTLAHLYKLLYWSKPNGKGLIPENLLRFNCDIVISEVRNYKRVIKAVDSNDLKIIKDNVSRYIYSLRECQFYFNTMPHGADIDLGGPKVFEESGYTVQFDYKFSTTKLERFVPKNDGTGTGHYIGYDGGAIWKIGNKGSRDSRNTGSGRENSIPNFYTIGENKLNQEGVDKPFVVGIPEDNLFERSVEDLDNLGNFKKESETLAKRLKNRLQDTAIQSLQREAQFFVNSRVAILNRTLNKIINAAGLSGIRPPRNVYEKGGAFGGMSTPAGRVFYDVKGDLFNFLGSELGGAIGGNLNRGF
jgi:hypothetical protein